MSLDAWTSGDFSLEVSRTSASIVLNSSVETVAAFAIAIIGDQMRLICDTAIMTEKRTLSTSVRLAKGLSRFDYTSIDPTLERSWWMYCRIPNQKTRAMVA